MNIINILFQITISRISMSYISSTDISNGQIIRLQNYGLTGKMIHFKGGNSVEIAYTSF